MSTTVSPRKIVTGMKLNYNKHCKLQFGYYVQTHEDNEPTNSMDSCTVGAIALSPANNLQGGYHFLNLHTGHKITQHQWTPLPMPKEVIAHVEQLAKAEGQPELLQFYDWHGNLL